jgi:uncharacterized protein YdcH (DUF465 family)
MNITLRKANAVQLTINEMVKGLAFDTSVQINEFEPAEAQIGAVHGTFYTNVVKREKLVAALYEIRKAVARANAQHGVDDKLADVAMLEKEIQFNNTFATKNARLSEVVLEGKLEKVRGMKEESRLYSRYDTIDTSIFTKEEVEGFKRTVADLKRQKQKLQDALLELNVRTEIELKAETAQFLESVDIL